MKKNTITQLYFIKDQNKFEMLMNDIENKLPRNLIAPILLSTSSKVNDFHFNNIYNAIAKQIPELAPHLLKFRKNNNWQEIIYNYAQEALIFDLAEKEILRSLNK